MAIKISFTGLTVLLAYLQVTQQSVKCPDFGEEGSRNASSGVSKKSRTCGISQSDEDRPKKINRRPSYHFVIPLLPEFTRERIESITLLEEAVAKVGGNLHPLGTFQWNIAELSDKKKKDLCIKAFSQESISVISGTQNTAPVCDISMTYKPTSAPGGGARVYYGEFIYYSPKEDEPGLFCGDMMRCNCAYTHIVKDKVKPVTNSKRFFFLLKQTENLYYVITAFGDLKKIRKVRIINVLEYNQ